MKILVVDDEELLVKGIKFNLQNDGYEVVTGTNGREAIELAHDPSIRLIVLDVMMPEIDGMEACRRIREFSDVPIIMLTARAEDMDKLLGFEQGADDYLTKPFMTKELLARIRALLRRSYDTTDGELSFGDISLNTQSATLSCAASGQSVRLGEKEYRILEYLIANQGAILTREQLALKIWGYDNEAEYNNVEVYMSFTRKKLAFIRSSTQIKAVRGIGYELRYDKTEA